MERRLLTGIELRAEATGDAKRISGIAAKYNVLSNDLGRFKERIAPGAFDRVLATNPDVAALIEHDNQKVLGRTTAGTLRLSADRIGLRYECDLPNTAYANDLYELVKRGDVNQNSFAFTLDQGVDDEYAEEDGVIVRTIRNFKKLFDVSAVLRGAYPQTELYARNSLVAVECRSFVERLLGPRYATECRAFIGLPQAEIDALVDNRDLTRYPLSGYELKQLSLRRQRLLGLLD